MERRRGAPEPVTSPQPAMPGADVPMPTLDALSGLVEHAKAHALMMKSYLLLYEDADALRAASIHRRRLEEELTEREAARTQAQEDEKTAKHAYENADKQHKQKLFELDKEYVALQLKLTQDYKEKDKLLAAAFSKLESDARDTLKALQAQVDSLQQNREFLIRDINTLEAKRADVRKSIQEMIRDV